MNARNFYSISRNPAKTPFQNYHILKSFVNASQSYLGLTLESSGLYSAKSSDKMGIRLNAPRPS
jgi:hypothetical protein